jgi:hypothetical protein
MVVSVDAVSTKDGVPFRRLGRDARSRIAKCVFVVCRPDYRGQRYCKDVCRRLGPPALRRRANAKHQRSEEGRRDHAEHQRALVTRKRAEAQAVTDTSRQKVAPRAEWSAPEDPPMLTVRTATHATVRCMIDDSFMVAPARSSAGAIAIAAVKRMVSRRREPRAPGCAIARLRDCDRSASTRTTLLDLAGPPERLA